ncbi:MAG: alcohol dehydrogenase, partial [Actinobacteria bacterium]
MRAAILDDGQDELVLTAIEHEKPQGREILVRTEAVGLCHSDLHFLDGVLKRARPLLLGHEAVGIVEAVGDEVGTITVGDRVVTCLVMGCGSCGR